MKRAFSLFFLLVALKLHAFDEEFLLERYVEHVQQRNLPEAIDWIHMWGEAKIENKSIAAAIENLLMASSHSQSVEIVDRLIQELGLPKEDKSLVQNLRNLALETLHDPSPTEDSYRQPGGVTVRYWIGVVALISGIIVAPFYPPAGKVLIAIGTGFLGESIPEAIGNQIDHNRAQKIKSLSKQIEPQLFAKFPGLGLVSTSVDFSPLCPLTYFFR